MHIGNLRTALYCYLLAKKEGSNFVLRIEDTDQQRKVEGAIENIVQTLHWAGLSPDEGVMLDSNGNIAQRGDKGPYIQSERLDIYQQYAQQLITSGNAYYAFDTPEELDRMRSEQLAAGVASPRYDSSVRGRMKNGLTMSSEEVQSKLDAGNPYVVRLLVPENRLITANDRIRGKVEWQSHTVDDTVLLKSDGFPTYHLAHVVDDHLMEVGLVLRGEEWLPSFPKHILLFEALGWEPPQYGHFPLILNKDKTKLSKRQNDVTVQDYIDQGYLPEVILNFLALLGWNPGTEQEIFTLEELTEQFSLERVQKAGAVFEREKLDWLQGQWMRRFPIKEFTERIRVSISSQYPDSQTDNSLEQKAALIQDRITFFHEAPEMLSYFYSEPKVDIELIANKKQKVTPDMVPELITILTSVLSEVDDANWNNEHLKEVLFNLCEEKELKRGQVLWPLRAILTGLPYSPGAFEVAAVLGKEKTMERLEKAKG